MANLASLIVNTARAIHAKKGTKMTSPIDFMPKWDSEEVREVKTQSVEEMKQILLGLGNRKFDTITSRKDIKKPTPNKKVENDRR